MVNLKKNYNADFIADIRVLLGKIHKKSPELRLCQILSIAAHKAGWKDDDLFYCPDEVILKGLNAIIVEKEGHEEDGLENS